MLLALLDMLFNKSNSANNPTQSLIAFLSQIVYNFHDERCRERWMIFETKWR